VTARNAGYRFDSDSARLHNEDRIYALISIIGIALLILV
jgi:hypothetical protein